MKLTSSIKSKLKEIVGEENFADRDYILYAYGADSSIHHALPETVIQPVQASQVVEIVKLAVEERIPLVPRGAGTALCGHTVPIKGGIVVDFQKMNRILEVKIEDLYCRVEPGVVYQDLNAVLKKDKFFFPPDPGSGEVCTIGGMVVANASGQRAIKYGATRDYVLGLTAVFPPGKLVKLGTKTLKDTSGYQLARFLVGSEGTLGLITELTLRLTPQPAATASVMAVFNQLEEAARGVGKIISSPLIPERLELMDKICIKAVNKAQKMALPEVEAILLIGLDGEEEIVRKDLEKVVKICRESGALRIDSTADPKKQLTLWKARKAMIPSLSRYVEGKACVSLADDLAVPMSKIPAAVKAFHQIAEKYGLLIPTYGHAGDGNLHTKFILDPTSKRDWEKAERAVSEMYEVVFSLGGTTTGEHGSGITKAPLMQKEKKDSLGLMKTIKKVLDPDNIMNPGKMMDWEGSFITQLRYQPEIEGPPCLKEWEREMNTCTYCGFCKAVCPIFKELGWDDCAARGKVLLAYGLLKGDLSPSSDLARGFYQCAQCLDCYRRCPSKIKTPQIIESVREYLVERGYFLPHHQILKEKIEQTGNIFGEKDLVSPQQEGEITLFIGCQYLSRLNKTKMYLRMLKQLGIKVKVRKEICCGVPLKTLGWQESFENHQEKFLALFGGEKEVITICPTCSVFLKEEYNLRTHHILKVLLEKLPQLKASHELVTYHDPCDLSRGLKMTTPPREVIKKLGYELVEMEGSKELSHCCGGGGGMLVSSPELVERIAERRIQEAYTTGAKYLITACPTCEQVLKNASQRKASRGEKTIAVVDIRDLLWKTLKPS